MEMGEPPGRQASVHLLATKLRRGEASSLQGDTLLLGRGGGQGETHRIAERQLRKSASLVTTAPRDASRVSSSVTLSTMCWMVDRFAGMVGLGGEMLEAISLACVDRLTIVKGRPAKCFDSRELGRPAASGFLNAKRSYIIILQRCWSPRRIVGLTSSTPCGKCGAIVAGAGGTRALERRGARRMSACAEAKFGMQNTPGGLF